MPLAYLQSRITPDSGRSFIDDQEIAVSKANKTFPKCGVGLFKTMCNIIYFLLNRKWEQNSIWQTRL